MKVVDCRKERFDIFIGRGSRWGNPFSHMYGTTATWIVDSREEAITQFEKWFRAQPEMVAMAKRELHGRTLGCYCSPGLPCHGDVLIKIANEK
jgi:hypothetical protein